MLRYNYLFIISMIVKFTVSTECRINWTIWRPMHAGAYKDEVTTTLYNIGADVCHMNQIH